MRNVSNFKRWQYLLAILLAVDGLVMGGVLLYLMRTDPLAEAAAAAAQAAAATPTPRPPTPTDWAGPPVGPTPTPTPTIPPTPLPTDVLAASGFPPGFTPTPRPTPTPVYITLPYVYPLGKNLTDVPEINQVYYPEPFFPAGTNNACGPVALFAALRGLGLEVEYSHVRDIAVHNGFGPEGISKWGLINTALTLNSDLGEPLRIEYNDRYRIQDLTKQIRKGSVVLVLVQVQKVEGRYRVTGDWSNAIGHFLLVERINLRGKKVKVAGSTLGMDQVPVADFIPAWSGQTESAREGWRALLKDKTAVGWALILKRN